MTSYHFQFAYAVHAQSQGLSSSTQGQGVANVWKISLSGHHGPNRLGFFLVDSAVVVEKGTGGCSAYFFLYHVGKLREYSGYPVRMFSSQTHPTELVERGAGSVVEALEPETENSKKKHTLHICACRTFHASLHSFARETQIVNHDYCAG